MTDIILSIAECNIQSRECTSRAHRFKDDLKDYYLLSDDGEMELTHMCEGLQPLLIFNSSLANTQAEKVFVTRVLEEREISDLQLNT